MSKFSFVDKANIQNNNCNEITVEMGGVEKISETMFDVFIANINRNILLNDMEKYVSVLKSGGSLLLSGFFSSDKEMLLDAKQKGYADRQVAHLLRCLESEVYAKREEFNINRV